MGPVGTYAVAALALFLAGCGADGAPTAPEQEATVTDEPGVVISGVTPGDTCGATRYGGLIGIDRAAAERAVADFITEGTRARLTGPGIPTTRDLRQDRINLNLGENGLVESVTCG